jgi:hypothetical protein
LSMPLEERRQRHAANFKCWCAMISAIGRSVSAHARPSSGQRRYACRSRAQPDGAERAICLRIGLRFSSAADREESPLRPAT